MIKASGTSPSLLLRLLVVPVIILMAAVAGFKASPYVLALLLAAAGGLILLQHLELWLYALVFAAILLPVSVGTGTEVSLNAAALIVPAVTALWILSMILRGRIHITPSRLNPPLFLFLIAGVFSLLIGNALWDPAVPRSNHFIIVQWAQWAIGAFSVAALLLAGNLIRDEQQLQRLTVFFLVIAGMPALLYAIPPAAGAVRIHSYTTIVFTAGPLWMFLTAMAAGQLMFNRELGKLRSLFCLLLVVAALVYGLGFNRDVVSIWLGSVAVLGMLFWLRWPRLRWPVIVLILLLLVSGLLMPALYEFAGGDDEWAESGGSRLTLIMRVLEVTWEHNPITGLGPAAYRTYSSMEPLRYGPALWLQPLINSHNNYVDLVAHYGVVGLALFGWFVVEAARLGLQLRSRYTTGFKAGYVNAMLAAGVGSLLLMLLLDWILPFVYNAGFRAFQASILIWMFMGGLVTLERISQQEPVQTGTSEYGA